MHQRRANPLNSSFVFQLIYQNKLNIIKYYYELPRKSCLLHLNFVQTLVNIVNIALILQNSINF